MSSPEKLGDRAARGIAWITGQSVFSRFVSYFAQLAVAWFLTREDFGLFGMALTISEFSRVFNQGGVSKVLVHRQKGYRNWVTPGLWLSLTMGLLVSASMVFIGYFACTWFQVDEPNKLFLLVCILAVSAPIAAVGTIPRALLLIQLRFRELALLSSVLLVVSALVKVSLAYAGYGAFSLVIPMVLSTVLQSLFCWYLAKPEIKLKLMINKWRYLFSDSASIIATSFWYKIITHGDYVILAAFATQSELGLYFFAFNYAVQTVLMFTQGIASIAFPALAKLSDDRERQVQAFRKGAAILSAVVFPASVAQCFLFKPVVEQFFPAIWLPAIPMLQLLSLGMAGRSISWLSASLMEAQGRFRERMWLGLFSAIVFVAMALAGVLLGKQYAIGAPLGMAIAVMLYYPLMSVATIWVTLKGSFHRVQVIREICLAPACLSLVAFCPTYLAALSMTDDRYQQIAVIAIVGSLMYLLLGRVWMNSIWNDLVDRVQRLIPARLLPSKNRL